MKRLIVYNIGEIATPYGELKRGIEMSKIMRLKNAFIVCEGTKIIQIGSGSSYENYINEDTLLYNAKNRLVTPSFIDSHTHLVHGGSRENEFGLKLNGVPYMEILKRGGGILSTVNATRNASFDELYHKALKSLNQMLLHGVTHVEAKSGYGLDLDTEIKQLEVAKQLNKDHCVDIFSTFLGAHALPLEYKDNREEFVNQVIDMLPHVREYAGYCDVFCEDGAFTIMETKKIIDEAIKLNYKIRLHSDEMKDFGASNLAIEYNAKTADHLMATSDYTNLGNSNVICNVLPATSFNLDKEFANVREMINKNCAIALSTDYNPGSSPSENIQFVMQLASHKMKMTPEEVLTAVTINPAYSLDIADKTGSIEIGKEANFIIHDAPNLEYILYHFGINHVRDVIKKGVFIVKDRYISNKR